MADLYMIPGFVEQLKSLRFHVSDAAGPTFRNRFWGGYIETTFTFRLNGIPVRVGEKQNPHRVDYFGPIPNPNDPTTLTFFSRNLRAYEIDGRWTRTDKQDHIAFP